MPLFLLALMQNHVMLYSGQWIRRVDNVVARRVVDFFPCGLESICPILRLEFDNTLPCSDKIVLLVLVYWCEK